MTERFDSWLGWNAFGRNREWDLKFGNFKHWIGPTDGWEKDPQLKWGRNDAALVLSQALEEMESCYEKP